MDVTWTPWKIWRRFAVKLEQSFEVAAPIERVWSALVDVERVAPCLPGASVTGRNEDGSYAGDLKIKIGPTTAAYSGRLEMETIDESSYTATMQAQGTDRRGQGGAKATITSKLSETDGGTHVDVSTDYHITGRLARFGRGGMIEDISNRLLREFASCLQASLVDKPKPAPAQAAAAAPADASAPAAASRSAEAEATGAPADTSEPAAGGTPGSASGEPTSPFPGATPESSNAIEGIPLVTSVLWERTRRNPIPAALVFGFLLALITLRRRRH
jgi:carbon monoxide dehydrogenase subunit G